LPNDTFFNDNEEEDGELTLFTKTFTSDKGKNYSKLDIEKIKKEVLFTNL